MSLIGTSGQLAVNVQEPLDIPQQIPPQWECRQCAVTALSVCLSFRLSIAVSMSLFLSLSLSACLLVYISTMLSAYPSFCASICLFVAPNLCKCVALLLGVSVDRESIVFVLCLRLSHADQDAGTAANNQSNTRGCRHAVQSTGGGYGVSTQHAVEMQPIHRQPIYRRNAPKRLRCLREVLVVSGQAVPRAGPDSGAIN